MALCILCVLFLCVVFVNAQDQVCYGGGSIALSVILSILLTVGVVVGLFILWKKYRKQKELILETEDPEKGKKSQYAFDNPGFKEVGFTPNNKLEQKNKWLEWSPLNALSTKNEKKKILDDSAIDGNPTKIVTLRSHDFTGLGFNICGNMKEGIFIKDVLHRGPASESGKLLSGDRIKSLTINFEHIVYEDALTILSYASPYEVTIEAKSGKIIHQTNQQNANLTHPIYRSSSCTELQNGNITKRKLFPEDNSTYSSLQKSRSNMTTLERKNSPRKQTPEVLKKETILPKFGIRVLPEEEKTPKMENDNNINLEKQPVGIDEVDKKPEIQKRKNNSIRRDENGIPQEIPNYMLNAALVAKTNRKNENDEEKKKKGRAPAPPPLDEIQIEFPTITSLEEEIENELKKNYNSDSDNDNSVNTIELNSSDITIHHSDENDERMKENRKTASTGDLTKIQKTARKISNGTLERAQSLDITDTKQPKAIDDENDLFGKVLKQPRLSLILDGLNTFQRNRLKKSTEWGNLEDAILNLNQDEDSQEFDALVDKINEIKNEIKEEQPKAKNQIWPVELENPKVTKRQRKPPIDLQENELIEATKNFIFSEKIANSNNQDRNISDDVKVSLNSLERLKSEEINISHIPINNSDLYITALEEPPQVTINTPDIIKNVTITEAINKLNESELEMKETPPTSLTYITEIQVTTPQNISEIEIIPNRNLDNEFENYVKNFENNLNIEPKIDPEKELHKIQTIAEEQFKKLPEMRFTTSSYNENDSKPIEKRNSIELLRSNFEKSPPKSRIPIKTPPTSPERRDSKENNEILELMQVSTIHSTPIVASSNGKNKTSKNVTVTSIRSNSKIPSARPIVAPRKHDDENVVQVSTNESSFKQWVFNPDNTTVTNIVVSENKK